MRLLALVAVLLVGGCRGYWKQHLDEYLRFYADALARC
jgi:hypothetical protein